MKPYVSLLLALGGLGAFTALSAQEVKLPALTPSSAAPSAPPSITKAPAAKAAATHTETEILQVIGWVMGKNSQVDTFDFTADQLASVWNGFKIAASDKEAPVSLDVIGPEVEAYVQKRQDAYIDKLKTKGTAEATKFFADLKSKGGVQFTASGLGYEILKPGTGANPKTTDTVTANYKGTMINGEVFDSTFDTGAESSSRSTPSICAKRCEILLLVTCTFSTSSCACRMWRARSFMRSSKRPNSTASRDRASLITWICWRVSTSFNTARAVLSTAISVVGEVIERILALRGATAAELAPPDDFAPGAPAFAKATVGKQSRA